MPEIQPPDASETEESATYEGLRRRFLVYWVLAGAAGGATGELGLVPGVGQFVWLLPAILIVAALVKRGRASVVGHKTPDQGVEASASFFITAFFIAMCCPVAGMTDRQVFALSALVISGGAMLGLLQGVTLMKVRKPLQWLSVSAAAGAAAAALAVLIYRATGAFGPGGFSYRGAGAAAGALYALLAGGALLWFFWSQSLRHSLVADQHLARGDFRAAADAYSRAIELSPREAELYVNRGVAYSELGDEARAAADYESALDLNPSLVAAYLNRGTWHAERNEFLLAIADFDRAIALDPSFAVAYSNRGAAYGNLGEWQNAAADYDAAIRIDPTYANAYSNRAHARYKRGDYDGAVSDCDRALALRPELAAAYSNRGLCHAARGDSERAAADFRRALELRCPPEVRREAEEGLRALGTDAT